MNKNMIYILLIIVVGILVFFLKNRITSNPDEVKAKIASGAMVVDVRTVGEYQSGHYPGALNIPVDQVAKRVSEFGEKDKPIIVYCASGGRSGSAKSYLESIGYTNITNAGGLNDMPR
ncbi:MAG: rhodanese-like domain-containing protein [Leptospira sp.]|nr:rhodanese-like domain-containing protein [Leptospira sp.]